ncbi:MAG TPA: hypothetical protein VNJ31_09250 [Methyloceanibacter sp.]|nr:hypothetical protein [Methyloceanibacter sp.]
MKPLSTLLSAAVLLAAASFAADSAKAQQTQPPNGASVSNGAANGYNVPRSPRRAGGYSLTLSDIWGPAEMPPAPKDFGPHFDFPPEPLNAAPLHDPYPN